MKWHNKTFYSRHTQMIKDLINNNKSYPSFEVCFSKTNCPNKWIKYTETILFWKRTRVADGCLRNGKKC